MSLRSDLIQDIFARLRNIASINLITASNTNDVFEAYMFGIATEAAERTGATIWYEDNRGQRTNKLLFRTSPGNIYAADTSTPEYTHAVLVFPNNPTLEIHQGIYVSGRSRLRHECDVAVLYRSEAQTCRFEKVSPRSNKVIIAVECKCYASGLGIDLGRGFIGFTSDLSSKGRFFVANTGSKNVEALLTHHNREWKTNVVPANPVEVNRVRTGFEDVYKRFLAST